MARTEYKFQYMPLEGRLPGKVMEQQTEDAINDLGIWLIDVSETADAASTLAQDAYDRAIEAQSTADKAQSAADTAQSTANEALRAAGNAQSTGDSAQSSADGAMAMAKAAQEIIDNHINDTDNPHQVTAEQLGLASAYIYRGTVDEYADLPGDAEVGDVYNVVNADDGHGIKAGDNVAWTGEDWDNLSGIVDLSSIEQEIKEVEDTLKDGLVADVDYADKVMTVTKGDGTSKNYTIDTCDCPNMIVDLDYTDGILEATYKDGTTKKMYINADPPLTQTTGTLHVTSDLSGDLTVNGNVEVDGNISGNVKASGTITYETLTGSITENAELTSCDIQVDNGTIRFIGSTSVSDGKISPRGIDNTADTVLYCDISIKNSNYNLTNSGTFVVSEGATVMSHSGDDDGIANSGTFVVSEGATVDAEGLIGISDNNDVWIINKGGTVTSYGGEGDGISGGTWTIAEGATVTSEGGADSYGVRNATMELNGTLYAYYKENSIHTSVTLTGTGKAYRSGTLYWENGEYV